MTRGAAFRGQPLLLLGGLLLGWLGLRAAMWQLPVAVAEPVRVVAEQEPAASDASVAEGRKLRRVAADGPRRDSGYHAGRAVPRPLPPAWSASREIVAPVSGPGPNAAVPRYGVRAIIGHNLLLAAGLSQMAVPSVLLAYLQDARRPDPGVPAAAPMLAVADPRPAALPRWSLDGWVLLRQGTTGSVVPGRPSYGRSQAGAVARYDLAPSSRLRPQAYLRASAALSGVREREVAAGVSGRIVPDLPLRFAAEVRAGEAGDGLRVRPAAFAVTELPPLGLPLGIRGEAYAQGGYVGGAYATAFVDGQARAERPLARVGGSALAAGAGVWGGAQKGAARLDIGPTAAVSFRLGPRSSGARGRVAADYRFRVAGDAEPRSGPALTLSAGF